MEKNLLKIFKLADILNEKQDKVYAHSKKLDIAIRSKDDYSYVEKFEVNLIKNDLIKWENIIELLENYVGGMSVE